MFAFIFVSVIVALAAIITAFLYISPEFGSADKSFSGDRIASSKQFDGEKFQNIEKSSKGGLSFQILKEYMNASDNRNPKDPLPVVERYGDEFKTLSPETRLTWFGHSAVLLEMEGKKIFIDPMLSDVAAPASFLGPSRYYDELPLDFDEIPALDAVIISHDHYDHLDYKTVRRLKSRVGMFFVPLGVGSHLIKWGVDPAKITELDWWEEAQLDGITFAATPARHFSGRGLTDGDKTLWASWVIKGAEHNIFFSGDSGYTKSFKDIGEKYGPFDIAMVESGQYNEHWKDIHMMPEDTVQTALDLKAELLMPIHWAAFTLALHDWDDPVIRVLNSAKQKSVNVTTPKIGESIVLGDKYPSSKWWEGLL